MRVFAVGALVAVVLVFAGATQPENEAASGAVSKGIKWLISVQGKDGGWGQDGGETSYVRVGERLESTGNDAANTSVAALALLHAGHAPNRGESRAAVQRALQFILRNVEQSPAQGLAVTNVTGSQIQRKLGPYIDTFLTSMLLSELDGNAGDPASNQRVRLALQKCVDKIERSQLKDGSWNIAGGWAPILGTSMASRSLYVAQQKGVKVEPRIMAQAETYAKNQVSGGAGAGSGVASSVTVAAEAAGVPLYRDALAFEQLSRTSADREKNGREISAITKRLSNPAFVRGYGSMGGEEFFSYLNISDGLHRAGGEEWTKWNRQIKGMLVKLQNEDGSWAGQHCITGRVAVTSAAVLTLLAERDQVLPTTAKYTKR